jgi:predicted RNA-binding Zn-ribbon protein involved in translation (DUF1610 family)
MNPPAPPDAAAAAPPPAACGRCGYDVRGLSSFTCPECGSDLREVGIVRPRSRRGLDVGWKLLILAVGWPVGALALLLIVSPFVTTSGPGGN